MTVLLLILSLFLFCSCSNSVSYGTEEGEEYANVRSEQDTLPGMIRLYSTGVTAFAGTTKAEAKANERPQIKTRFDYDFSISIHETTCSEFNSLMDLQVDCENKQYHATNVTYYDAVLFANARSVYENKDTAYTYTEASFDKDGHCTNLNGLAFRPQVDAYRLPTEAEWILAASQGWSPKNGWTADNSEYRLHEVCSSTANKVGACDMEGNVKEWVNDWLGLFRDTTVTDFLGAPDGGGVGERVVKGGSYRNERATVTLYSRGDVYLVTSSNKADYIGFRLAYGAIPNPSWIDRKGNSNESPVDIMAASTTIRAITGTFRTKLFFRNDVTGNLTVIDYSSTPALITEIRDSLEVYHPDVSPDGNWVAFSTKSEGLSGKSSVYVRSATDFTAAAFRLDVESAAIPRWRVLESGDTVIVYVTDAGNNQDEAAFLAQSTWQVKFAAGKFGTPQKLFDGTYHGGVSEKGNIAVTGSSTLRVRIAADSTGAAARDTVWYGGDQACNVSLSKDGTNRTAFLDFSGKLGREFVGQRYGVHEWLFIADSTGKLIQKVKAPSGFTFDHTEWAGKGIVATLTNANGAHNRIVYVDVEDGSITDLAKGEELWHPCLWIKHRIIPDKSVLDLDSAGIYYWESAKFCVYELRKKMEQFWTQRGSFTAVAFGSSRTLFGLDPREMKSETLLNFGYSGGDMIGTEYLFRNYILNHRDNVKYIIVEVTPNAFWRLPEHDWYDIFNTNAGFHYDQHHDFWKDGVPEGFIDAVIDGPTMANTETLPYRDEFTLPSVSWQAPVIDGDSTFTPYDGYMVEENFARFQRIVDWANEAGIKVIALNYPVHPGYGQTIMVGPYGPTSGTAKRVLDRVASMGVILMDENNWGNHDYTDEMAYDPDHLSYLGAIQLTHRLDSLLQTLK
jgi:uncharacterized protein (TIGR02171 family)